MAKEDYMRLPKERLAELLVERDNEVIQPIDSLQDKPRRVLINGRKLVMKDGAWTFLEAPGEEAAAKYIASYYQTHHTDPDMISLFLAGAEWGADHFREATKKV